MYPNALIQLPNKDLWRGYVVGPADAVPSDAELVPETAQNPVNKAMAQMLKQAQGASYLNCMWCGLQGDEKYIRAHIQADHKTKLFPSTEGEQAMAALALAQKPVLEAAANATE